jgi:Bacterial protein of unknown function (DUF882)
MAVALFAAPAHAQGLFGLLRGPDSFSVFPSNEPPGQPLSLLPINPKARAKETEQPEVVDAEEVAAAGKAEAPRRQSIPMPPRLAAYADTNAMTSAIPMRPPGLRESEHPVAGMPGVFADEDAVFGCLPSDLKQVLMDTAARFGHVAILNAKRSRGTGARGSYHYMCRAVDFRVRGVAIRTVYGYLRSHPNVGGRKIYPMGFFHIDNGPSRSW